MHFSLQDCKRLNQEEIRFVSVYYFTLSEADATPELFLKVSGN